MKKLIELNDIAISETGVLSSDSSHFYEIIDEVALEDVYGGINSGSCTLNIYCPGSGL